MDVSPIVDAAGNIPVPMSAFERRIAEKTADGGMKKNLAELARKQALPLEEKIELSKELIRNWYEYWEGKVSVSYSGGKDSSVLLWLVRFLYPDVPAVFSHTGLEYPEVVRLVLDTPNHIILRPEMSFKKVVQTYGWPIGSKKIARGVNIVRNPTGKNQNIIRLYLDGINRFGRKVNGFKIAQQWRFLFDAPFDVSDKCCDVMKKKPMREYERATGNRPLVGTMASDSKQRQRNYLLQDGCNAYTAKRPLSAPMSFWTEQDVLHCIDTYKITIPSVYGNIIQDSHGIYQTTGVRRTGCVFCCFGLHMDEGPLNRFERLALTHPKLHRYVIDQLGLGKVLAYCQQSAPDRLARSLRWEKNNCQQYAQANLFD